MVNGKFDEATRAMIRCWQAARGSPKTGFLTRLQLKALQSEIVATRVASADDGDGALFGGMMGGLFRC